MTLDEYTVGVEARVSPGTAATAATAATAGTAEAGAVSCSAVGSTR